MPRLLPPLLGLLLLALVAGCGNYQPDAEIMSADNHENVAASVGACVGINAQTPPPFVIIAPAGELSPRLGSHFDTPPLIVVDEAWAVIAYEHEEIHRLLAISTGSPDPDHAFTGSHRTVTHTFEKDEVMRYLVLLLALAPGPAWAELNLPPSTWTREDTYRQAALTALLVVDWGQTRYIVKHPSGPGGYWRAEGYNRFLGDYPSITRVNNYFAASLIGHAAIAYVLPPAWRHGWQYLWIGVEANTVERNRHIGIKMEF